MEQGNNPVIAFLSKDDGHAVHAEHRFATEGQVLPQDTCHYGFRGARVRTFEAECDVFLRVGSKEEEGKGFILHLDHEYDYVLDSEQRKSLEAAISRYERDRFLDEYYSLFGPLDHFVRREAQNKRL